jgi:uncharacterized protein (TIGR00255 family)
MICSMTGYASRLFYFNGENYKIEVKTLNHRFLELKFRMPKEWVSLEASVRTLFESKMKRGSVELWVERANDNKNNGTEIKVNIPQAEKAMELFREIQRKFKITDPVTLKDLLGFPDVITKPTAPHLSEEAIVELKEVFMEELSFVVDDLVKMRGQEGEKIKKSMMGVIEQFKNTHLRFLNLRVQMQKRAQEKVKKRVEQCFESFTTPDAQMRALMETRIAQEITFTLDKMDIEEELNRFKGHVDQIEHLMNIGGLIGKKLDFMFQELNREVNTLGNKAQDLDISHDVIELKTWLEQLREQSLNLE